MLPIWAFLLGFTFLLNPDFAYAGDAKPPEKNLGSGKALYEKNCTQCHGEKGDAKGVSEAFVFPKPRDFTAGLYKIRTTPAGKVPVDDDLFKIIANGMPGSSMPAWGQLSVDDRWQLVHYIKTFSPKFEAEKPEKVVTTPKVPANKDDKAALQKSLEIGKQFYQDLECWKCHGQEGRGDGPSAPELVDEWKNPVRPANLTKNWTFRGGGTVEDIYMRILTGVGGTPMPSYADVFETDADRENFWHLANYVKSLSPDVKPEPKALNVKLVQGDLSVDPEDPRWKDLEGHYFPLSGQITFAPRLFTPSLDSVSVKAMHNGKEVAFLVMWDDITQDPKPVGSGAQASNANTLSDAIAIQFPVKIEGFVKPYFIMGDSERAVNLWIWKPDGHGVKESNASGITKETPQDQASQNVEGKGIYSQGQWRVVFKRALVTQDKDRDITIEAGKFIPVAFSAWDGSNGDEGAKRSVSAWYYLFLEAPKPITRYTYPALAFLLVAAAEIWFVKRNKQGR